MNKVTGPDPDAGDGIEFKSLDAFSAYLPLREAVAQTLRQAILDGSLRPGQTITENSLAKQLSVSRTPVREAIRMLEGEHLVTLVQGRRFIVSVPTIQDIEEIYDIRLILESEALRRITPDHAELIARLKECTDLGQRYLRSGDVVNLERTNSQFHLEILSVLENRILEEFVDSIHARIAQLRFYTLADKEWAARWEAEHQEIVRCLERGDTKKAIEVLRLHLTEPKRRLIAKFSDADPQ